ncbi:unnamed protein product [Blepharisma stoltei]|uniref:LITAF domain-containing protein n=1 Tax=Blepharisma stoltei TaxID=1481888 RepID=A0AAU9K0M2_9CILI|nr:unnamed protein product [Blepharisma stoltei]
MKNLAYARNAILHLEPKRSYRNKDKIKEKDQKEVAIQKEVDTYLESSESANSESSHTRQPTMIINDLNKTQPFVSALNKVPADGLPRLETSLDFWDHGVGSLDLNFTYDSGEILSSDSDFEDAEKCQEPLKSFAQDSTKNSIKQSLITETKSYITHKTVSKISEKIKDSANTKPTLSTHENEPDSQRDKPNLQETCAAHGDPMNYVTSKGFCPKCECEVSTTVKFKFPSISFWQKLCCRTCYGSGEFQEILYHCKKCKTLISRIKRSKN